MATAVIESPAGEVRFDYACPACLSRATDGMVPPHNPSPNCQSGKRPHCTCSACY